MSIYFRFLFSLTILFTNWTSFAQPISAGWAHSLVICADSTVMSWGINNYGQLGIGDTIDRNQPVKIPNLVKIIAVSAGGDHSLALKNDGTVWAWGQNNEGMLGDGTTVNKNSPVQVSGLTNVIAISANLYHSLALKDDGTVWAWGSNFQNYLGDGTDSSRSIPTRVLNLSNAIAISAGPLHSLALKSDGTVWTWGYNIWGQLGTQTGNYTEKVAVPVIGLNNIVKIATGWDHSYSLKNDGTVWAWGYNAEGELGNGTIVDDTIPSSVNNLLNVTDIAGGAYYGLAIKNDGTVWAWGDNYGGKLGDGTSIAYRTLPVKVRNINNSILVSAGEHSFSLEQNGTVWGWGDNVYTPVQVNNLCYVFPWTKRYSHYIDGQLFADLNNDCNKQISERSLTFPVFASPGNFYTVSNDTGYYSLGINDSVNYIIQPIIPLRLSAMAKNPCPANYNVYLNSSDPQDTTAFDFGFEISPCHLLRTDISADRKRRCFLNNTVVYYTNEGLIAANNVEVHVKFDQYDIPLLASTTYTIDSSDSSLIFNIGALNANQSGYITIIDSIACVSGITGLTQCTKAWITPSNTCLDSATAGTGWDKSSIKVKGACINDTVGFVIKNDGSGNMSTASQYRIYFDNSLSQTVSFQLNSGDSLVVTIVSSGATIRLEADQNPGHPGYSHPRATVEACGTGGGGIFSLGQVNQAPMDDEDVNVEIDCMEIRDSYDPNEKVVSPEGIDASHRVLPNTPLDFVIHFQNTGTDTAYKVVVIDTLSSYLDLSTLEPGVSSNPYKLSISGEGIPVLKFTLENINLVDSTSNEPMSHGFVKYKIAPFSSTPLGTQITNAADIYFDYNFPIRTNTAFVTLGNYFVLGVNEVKNGNSSLSIYPNPTTGNITISTSKENPIQKIILYSIDGKKVFEREETGKNSSETIDIQTLSSGIYFMECISKNASEKVKVVKN